jgi:hypothetical protein
MTVTYQLYAQAKLTVLTSGTDTKIPITYQSLGRQVTTYNNATIWADQHSVVSIPKTIFETPGIRLVNTGNTTLQAIPGIYKITFEKEVSVMFNNTNLPNALVIKGVITSPSNSTKMIFNTPIWVLAGSRFNITSPLYSLNNTRRTIITPSTGTLPNPMTITLTSQTQDMINEATGAGAASTTHTQWVNSTQPITLTAPSVDTWQFSKWVGTVNSTNSTITIQPIPNLKETAVYNPEIVISALSGGSIEVSYDNTTLTIQAGQSSTLYIPVGTVINLIPSPTNIFYEFNGWSGGITSATQTTSSPPTTSFTVSSPTVIIGTFEYNIATIVVAVGGIVTIIALLDIALRRRC